MREDGKIARQGKEGNERIEKEMGQGREDTCNEVKTRQIKPQEKKTIRKGEDKERNKEKGNDETKEGETRHYHPTKSHQVATVGL